MIAECLPSAYSVRTVRAQGRRLRVASYYEIRRDNLVALRVRRHLTQERLAKKAGVSKQTITRMETGANTPQFDTIEKVAAALDTEPDALIVYRTPLNDQLIDEAQRDWEERNEDIEEEDKNGGDNDSGDRRA